MSYRILDLRAWEVLDSRGQPTVACEVLLEGGALGRGIAPSGASRGKNEVMELRDQDPRRYHGKGVLKALANITEVILPAVRGKSFEDPEALDTFLESVDGTPDLSVMGGNATTAVSVAFARAVAATHQVPLYALFAEGRHPVQYPVPLFNLINGGVHASNSLDIQEFLVIPNGMASVADHIRAGSEIYQVLGSLLRGKGFSVAVGDEGGFAPDLGDTRAALDLLMNAVERAGYRPGSHVFLGMDAAASQLYSDNSYRLDGKSLTAEKLAEFWLTLATEYPLIYLEDPMNEESPDHWRLLMNQLGGASQKVSGLLIVADDLTVTNADRVREFSDLAGALLVKVNQAGTIRRALEAVTTASEAGWEIVVSHRSGDSEDPFIADFAVGIGAWGLKAGAPSRGERTAKYNRLLEIAWLTRSVERPEKPTMPQPQPVLHSPPE
ncbi:MAG: phosphopyruvate hydratase [bacterium JZ-2024 1]